MDSLIGTLAREEVTFVIDELLVPRLSWNIQDGG